MPDPISTGCPFSGAAPTFPQQRLCPISPPPAYYEWREEGPLKRVTLWDGQEVWMVLGHEESRTLLNDPRVSADSSNPNYPGVNRSMTMMRKNFRTFISMDPPEHTIQRRMLTGEFTLKRIEAMRPMVQAMADKLLDNLTANGANGFDFVEEFAFPLTSNMICGLLGVPYEDHDFFQAKAAILASAKTSPEDAAKASKELCTDYIGSLIRKKDAAPQDDLLSRLVVNYMRPGTISYEGLIALSRLLLVAGHETSANTMSVGLLALLQHPEQLAELRANQELMPNAVEEILRYCDVTHGGRRRVALEDIEIAGQTIRAGEGIICHNQIANRSPEAFDDPDRFDIHRDARGHMAFGHGVHQCLGQPLARLELNIGLTTMLRRLPDFRLAVPAETLKFKSDMLVYGVHNLPLTW
ncbi:cytochrome P450 [Bordetella sp. 2513F-2]